MDAKRLESAHAAAAGLAGVVFGVGLALAQMTNPLKILGFLDVAGAWDPSLLFVLGGAVGVAAIGFRVVLRRPSPALESVFRLPARGTIDVALVAGAAIFGAGWGLAGYCPGPAIASLGFGNQEAIWFVPAMLAGAGLRQWQLKRSRLAGSVETSASSAG